MSETWIIVGFHLPPHSHRFRIPLTIKDESSTMDCIAFYNVGDNLVGCSALEASQNMQIEPDNHPPVLKTAIGKKMMFNIGMSIAGSSRNPIKYILKKCFPIDNQGTNDLEEPTKDTAPSKEIQAEDVASTPPSTEPLQKASVQESSNTKRRLDLNQEDLVDPQAKQSKKQ